MPTMKRIHFAVFGVGLGHASRMKLIADQLKKDGSITNFSSFYYAVEYLRKSHHNCIRVPPMPIGWKDEGVSTIGTFAQVPRYFSNLFLQIKEEIRIIRKFKPDIVLSDSRLSAVIASYLLGIPSIAISNQLRILLPPKYHLTSLNWVERLNAELLGLFWNLSKKIIVPDLPPPYSISEKHTRSSSTTKGRINYTGFIIPTREFDKEYLKRISEELHLSGRKKIIFVQVSGPPETLEKMLRTAIMSAESLSNRFIFIISKGRVGGTDIPNRINGGWLYEWCPIKDELFRIADLIVLRAGHSSLSQAIISKKPIISIPIKDHSEQVMNSEKIEKMGIGLSLDPTLLNEKNLNYALEKIFGDPSFKKQAIKIGNFASRHNGVKNTINMINSLI